MRHELSARDVLLASLILLAAAVAATYPVAFRRDEKEVFVRSYLGAELVRVGLPVHWSFLKEILLEEVPFAGAPNVGQSVIETLGKPPLSSVKRAALLDLLRDDRFAPLLMQPTGPALADRYRSSAARALEAHARREVVTIQILQDLGDPSRAKGALAEIRKIATDVLGATEEWGS